MTTAIRSDRYHKIEKRRRIVFTQKCTIFVLATIFFLSIGVLLGSNLSAAAKSNADNQNTYKYYKSIQVETGDSLWSIASEYISSDYSGYSEYIEEIMSLNHLSEETIHAGQYLMIPYYSDEYK